LLLPFSCQSREARNNHYAGWRGVLKTVPEDEFDEVLLQRALEDESLG
jgi:hypothetical protein